MCKYFAYISDGLVSLLTSFGTLDYSRVRRCCMDHYWQSETMMRSHFIFCGEDVEDDDYFFIVVWVSHHNEIEMIVMTHICLVLLSTLSGNG